MQIYESQPAASKQGQNVLSLAVEQTKIANKVI